MSSLRIIGAGGHGKVVADTAARCGYKDIAFWDTAWPTKAHNGQWSVIGTPVRSELALFCGIGNNTVRASVSAEFALDAAPILIDPSAVISPSVRIGNGTLVVAGVIVNADAVIGKGTILNTGCSVDHDCVIGDFVHISPGARLAGNVTVGAGSWIGIGAVVREGIRIGTNVMVGAGAAVVADIPDNTRVGGVPAKPL